VGEHFSSQFPPHCQNSFRKTIVHIVLPPVMIAPTHDDKAGHTFGR
jgi:hypothetical protein